MNTKEKIKKTANDLISQKDYKSISLNMIADKVGIKKPSIYHYFKSKESIYEEVMSDFVDYFEKEVDIILKSNKKPLEKVRDFISLCVKPGAKKVNFKFFLLEKMYRENYSKEKIKQMLQRRNALLKKIEKIISEHIKDKKIKVTNREITLAIMGAITMFIAERAFSKKQEFNLREVEEMTDNIMFIIFNKI